MNELRRIAQAPSVEFREQDLKILVWHHNVDIIVPGNESLVASSPDQRSVSQVIAQAVRFTDVFAFFKKSSLTLDFFATQFFH